MMQKSILYYMIRVLKVNEGEIMDWDKFWTLYHRGWGQAKVSSEYDKKVFNEMQQMLQSMEHEKKKEVVIQDRRKQERRNVV